MDKERCLISGSHGFIGKALSKELTGRGHKVIQLKRELLYDLESLEDYLELEKPDWIFHLAAYGNKYSQKDDYEMWYVNTFCTMNLAYASRYLPYKAFINIGSSSEYGVKQKSMVETDSLEAKTMYACTKAASTILLRGFASTHDKPIVTARPFSVYGEGDDPKHFIPTAIKAFKENKELQLAKGVHDWIHVDDVVSGLIKIARNVDKLKGGVVNIGTGIQHTNYDIVAMLRICLGIPGNIKHIGQIREYDTDTFWVADNSLLSSLGWSSKHRLGEDLERMALSWKK